MEKANVVHASSDDHAPLYTMVVLPNIVLKIAFVFGQFLKSHLERLEQDQDVVQLDHKKYPRGDLEQLRQGPHME